MVTLHYSLLVAVVMVAHVADSRYTESRNYGNQPSTECFDPDEGIWKIEGETTRGGAGCGGCTCMDGKWHCSSCGSKTLSCPRINCDVTCDSGKYEVRTDATTGCRKCRCFPAEYCQEVCDFCTDPVYALILPCPKQCDC